MKIRKEDCDVVSQYLIVWKSPKLSVLAVYRTEMEQKVNESWKQFKYTEKVNKFSPEIQLKYSITSSVLPSLLWVVNHDIIWKLYLKPEMDFEKRTVPLGWGC